MSKIAFLLFLVGGFLAACSPPNTPAKNQDLTDVDSAYSICKEVYLWNENLPKFTPKELTKFTNTQVILEFIREYSTKYNQKPLDRWSFSVDKEVLQNIEQNTAIGFGIDLAFWGDDDLRARIVYQQSDAYQKGLRRGTKILLINDIDAKIENKALIMNAIKKQNISIEFINQAKQKERTMLQSSFFQKETLINAKILDNTIGYFYFDIFEGGNRTVADLKRLFEGFRQQNIDELIIDLRYNHGGSGVMAQFVANHIVPQIAKGKVFSRVVNNTKYSLLNYSLYFDIAANNLNLKRVFFITTPETASASEVLINALQAVMEVKVIGTRTHGKPFGFIAYKVGDNFIFPIAFKALNDKGYGDYYDGIPVDFEVEDDLTHDFGDTEESCLKSVLAYIKNGQFPASQLKNKRLSIERQSINEQEIPSLFYLSKPRF